MYSAKFSDKKDGCLEKLLSRPSVYHKRQPRLGRVKRDRSLLLIFFFEFLFQASIWRGNLSTLGIQCLHSTQNIWFVLKPPCCLLVIIFLDSLLHAGRNHFQADSYSCSGFCGFHSKYEDYNCKGGVFQKDFLSHPVVMDSFP